MQVDFSSSKILGYSSWHQISENLLHILVIFFTRFCWIQQNLLRNLLKVSTDWYSIWCQNLSLYRKKSVTYLFQICRTYTKEFCHLLVPNLLNLQKGILSQISSSIFQSGESYLFPISDFFSFAIALACFFINLFMRLQSGESFTFYTKEFCQKKSSWNFQSGEFYSFRKSGVFAFE